MARTVNGAFEEFMINIINLDSDETQTAKASRKWLMEQIAMFPEKDKKFPEIYTIANIFYGSFARRTMKRPLNDVDIMICLKANGCYYTENEEQITINASNGFEYYTDLCHDGTKLLNSKKVINKFLANLSAIPQYKNAEIKRNMEAATLSLLSYNWVYDIVPCFLTAPNEVNRTYYIIPDGLGYWKKTDPRRDQKRVDHINSLHNGNILKIIRLVKYWNKRATMPSIPSYLLENMILNYYTERVTNKAEHYIDVEFTRVLRDIITRIYNPVNDPKEIQGDLNILSGEEKRKISERAETDLAKAIEARNLEDTNDHDRSIKKWIEVFGDRFPKYN